MLPMSIPERTSCPSVVIAQRLDGRDGTGGQRAPGAASLTLAPRRQGHHDWGRGRQFCWEDLLVAGLGPLPDPDRRPQVLAGILGIIGPVEICELDAAAVHQRAFG